MTRGIVVTLTAFLKVFGGSLWGFAIFAAPMLFNHDGGSSTHYPWFFYWIWGPLITVTLALPPAVLMASGITDIVEDTRNRIRPK